MTTQGPFFISTAYLSENNSWAFKGPFCLNQDLQDLQDLQDKNQNNQKV